VTYLARKTLERVEQGKGRSAHLDTDVQRLHKQLRPTRWPRWKPGCARGSRPAGVQGCGLEVGQHASAPVDLRRGWGWRRDEAVADGIVCLWQRAATASEGLPQQPQTDLDD
jgi:hypothetical protein